MTSRAEQHTARALRRLLAANPGPGEYPHSPALQELLDGLEYLLPELLADCHDWPPYLALDGVLCPQYRVLDPWRIRLRGRAILLGGPHDQRVAPVQVQLRLAAQVDALAGFVVKLGERDRDGRLRSDPLHTPAPDPSAVDWAFQAVRRP
ncbi:hypothetical protein [Nannocystis punicea]|uniref:Uncharacterized protein n=1 Tax=Nannocystis punicea TaxID=2995304 RepID=A0ABY7H9R8_9BACT|nr:hypothetical protein [Nannocystis poenicansa]WAS95993.1 hypothetical protein O0S08_07490 [Nannocystis poenicansa]